MTKISRKKRKKENRKANNTTPPVYGSSSLLWLTSNCRILLPNLIIKQFLPNGSVHYCDDQQEKALVNGRGRLSGDSFRYSLTRNLKEMMHARADGYFKIAKHNLLVSNLILISSAPFFSTIWRINDSINELSTSHYLFRGALWFAACKVIQVVTAPWIDKITLFDTPLIQNIRRSLEVEVPEEIDDQQVKTWLAMMENYVDDASWQAFHIAKLLVLTPLLLVLTSYVLPIIAMMAPSLQGADSYLSSAAFVWEYYLVLNIFAQWIEQIHNINVHADFIEPYRSGEFLSMKLKDEIELFPALPITFLDTILLPVQYAAEESQRIAGVQLMMALKNEASLPPVYANAFSLTYYQMVYNFLGHIFVMSGFNTAGNQHDKAKRTYTGIGFFCFHLMKTNKGLASTLFRRMNEALSFLNDNKQYVVKLIEKTKNMVADDLANHTTTPKNSINRNLRTKLWIDLDEDVPYFNIELFFINETTIDLRLHLDISIFNNTIDSLSINKRTVRVEFRDQALFLRRKKQRATADDNGRDHNLPFSEGHINSHSICALEEKDEEEKEEEEAINVIDNSMLKRERALSTFTPTASGQTVSNSTDITWLNRLSNQQFTYNESNNEPFTVDNYLNKVFPIETYRGSSYYGVVHQLNFSHCNEQRMVNAINKSMGGNINEFRSGAGAGIWRTQQRGKKASYRIKESQHSQYRCYPIYETQSITNQDRKHQLFIFGTITNTHDKKGRFRAEKEPRSEMYQPT